MQRYAFAVVLALAGCGGSGPDMRVKPPSKEQGPLAAAMAAVCAAPTRAEHDPEFGDPGARNDVLFKHLTDGVTHPEVLATIDGWRHPDKSLEQRASELDALLARAGLATRCRLVEVFSDSNWGASELEPAPE
jgi:hypothetical protein